MIDIPILTDAGLQRLSDWITRNVLKDECTVMRNSPVQTTSGGMTDHWVQVGNVRKCALLDAGSPGQQVVADQEVGSISKMLLFARGEDIRGDDRIVYSGFTYTVVDLFEPSTYAVTTRVLVRRASLQGGT